MRRQAPNHPRGFTNMKTLSVFILVISYLHDRSLRARRPAAVERKSHIPNHWGAQASSLQGQVLKHDGSPTAGIIVRITGAGATQTTVTNEAGEFQFTGPATKRNMYSNSYSEFVVLRP